MPYFGNDPTDTIINNIAGGKFLQVQSTSTATTTNTTNTSATDVTNMTDTITCASSSNSVLVLMMVNFLIKATSDDHWAVGELYVVRTPSGGSDTTVYDQRIQRRNDTGASGTGYFGFEIPIMFVDAPSSTAELTYKLQMNRVDAGGAAITTDRVYVNYQTGEIKSYIQLIEIDGT